MMSLLITVGRWIADSRTGRSFILAGMVVVIGAGLWSHGYYTHKGVAKQDRLTATLKKQQDRMKVDEDVRASHDRDLCRSLGGGMQCDRF